MTTAPERRGANAPVQHDRGEGAPAAQRGDEAAYRALPPRPDGGDPRLAAPSDRRELRRGRRSKKAKLEELKRTARHQSKIDDAQTKGACGGIDFWGNCWEWTSTARSWGKNAVKGGAFDSKRTACRNEARTECRSAGSGYANVTLRVVREDR